MFVDDLPDMPRVQGFSLMKGVPVSESLKIGMYEKKWVCSSYDASSSLIFFIFYFRTLMLFASVTSMLLTC